MPLALSVTVFAWVAFELVLRVRDVALHQGGWARDRATRVLIGLTLGLTFGLAVAASHGHSLRIPDGFRIAGLAVMWAGLALRVWAVVTLGRSFRTSVEVDPGQAVVSNGPYRWIRHPSYTGLLLIAAGFGLAVGDWISFAICLVAPAPALLWRIHVEEAELVGVLGEPYVEYEAHTKRLIPGLW